MKLKTLEELLEAFKQPATSNTTPCEPHQTEVFESKADVYFRDGYTGEHSASDRCIVTLLEDVGGGFTPDVFVFPYRDDPVQATNVFRTQISVYGGMEIDSLVGNLLQVLDDITYSHERYQYLRNEINFEKLNPDRKRWRNDGSDQQ